jgi:hypothetical protein
MNALCISATMHVFVYDFRKGSILPQMQWKGFGTKEGNKDPVTFPELQWFHFSVP